MSEQGIAASLSFAGIVRDPQGRIVNIVVTEESPELYQSLKDRIQATGEECPKHIMEKINVGISARTGEASR